MLEALGEIAPASKALEASSIWTRLGEFTPARIGVAPTGVSQPTDAHLAFQWDHAQARDAVGSLLDLDGLRTSLGDLGMEPLALHSEAADRAEYIQRPDLGRRLNPASLDQLARTPGGWDVVFVIADGLSATAANRHAAPLLSAVLPALRNSQWKIGPAVLIEQGRVAVGDAVAEALGADMAVVLIGERPGLTTPDSLGVYLVWRPRGAVADSQRNCLSNIRPEGLPYPIAAARLLYLMREARRRHISGVHLKEEADLSPISFHSDPGLPGAPAL
ncbi:MAG: ethanolamine ammonia-lyase subunit EutC [Capsulimonas sp.]|uniref:ethanolamine ammonia-lyase subunit EutC n=1 Tax=Capsulimonas sp. TaxID=2494211 RepID=UPI003262E407